MKKIGILNVHQKNNFRGSEFWADSLKEKLSGEVNVSVFSNVWIDFGKWIKSDIIVPTNGRSQVFFVRLASWLFKKPMVVFGHSGPGADDKWNLLCSPDVFVAFSTSQKEWAEKFRLPWTKIVLISHAVDLKRFTPIRSKPNKKIVLCVAANSPSKRIDLVEEAVKLIPGATLLAVGKDNPVEASFNEMPGVYKKADVFCFVPQPREAFGLVFLEALASGLPVVTINDPVRKEIVGDAGILVDDPENAKSLANAIKKALNADWGDKSRKQAEKFSWDKIKSDYIDLFKNLA